MEKKKKPAVLVIILLFVVLIQVAVIVYLKFNYTFDLFRESDNDKELPISLTISEICAENFNILADEMGDTPGYIELYNNSDRVVNLSHYYITNGDTSFKLPKRTLDPGQFRLVYASSFVPVINEEGEISEPKGIFCGFSVKPGDVIKLSDSEHIVHQITIGEISENESFSYIENHFEKSRPTPLAIAEVDDSLDGIPAAPEFSLAGGFYDTSKKVELKAKASKIFYTLDSSEPTEDSMLYTAPIAVCDGEKTIIRAVAVSDEGKVSPVSTSTYFTGAPTERKTISLVTDKNLSDVTEPGAMSEITVSLEYMNGETAVLSENCGMRVLNPDSLKPEYVFYQRAMYNGKKVFSASPFDEDKPLHSFTAKKGASDEAALYALFREAGILTRKTAEADIYLNGEFLESAVLFENYDSTYLKNYCDIEENDLILLSNESHKMKEYKEYTDLLDFVASHDMTDEDNYASFTDAVDVESLIRYMAANLYLGNLDISQTENVLLFRTTKYIDSDAKNGKWHWLSNDLSIDCQYSENVFPHLLQGRYGGSRIDYPIMVTLLKNEDFKNRFLSIYFSMMNTVFDPAYSSQTLASLGINDLDTINFLNNRPEYATSSVVESLNIQDTICTVSIMCQDENFEITLDDVPLIFNAGFWQGKFVQGTKLEFEALSTDGRKFKGWSGDLETRHSVLITNIDQDTYLIAEFKNPTTGGNYEYSMP